MKTLVVVLLGLWGVAEAQELDKRQAGLLKRLSPQIATDTGALGKIGDEKWQFTQRVVDDYKRKIVRYESQLKDLPAEQEDVKKVLAELEALRALLAKRAEVLTAKVEAAADNVQKLTALFTAPEVEGDTHTLSSLATQFKSFAMYHYDSYVFARWPDHRLVVQLREWAESFAESEKTIEALQAKYAEGAAFRGKLEGKAQLGWVGITTHLKDVAQFSKHFKESLDAFAKSAPDQIEKEGALLMAATEKAVAANDYLPFIQPEGPIERLRYRITNIAAIWAPLAASDEARKKLAARAEALLEQSEKAADKLAESIIRENKGPQDKYSAADRAKLESHVRSAWSKKYPSDAILAVRFDASSFERHTAWKFDPSTHAFVKTDESNIPVWVIVKDGPKRAIKYFCSLYKLHLRGDSLTLGFPYRSPKGPAPIYRLLASNL